MSFYCRHMTGRDYCSRRDADCKPGAEGCVLHGRVRLASDIERESEEKKRARRKTKNRPVSDG